MSAKYRINMWQDKHKRLFNLSILTIIGYSNESNKFNYVDEDELYVRYACIRWTHVPILQG